MLHLHCNCDNACSSGRRCTFFGHAFTPKRIHIYYFWQVGQFMWLSLFFYLFFFPADQFSCSPLNYSFFLEGIGHSYWKPSNQFDRASRRSSIIEILQCGIGFTRKLFPFFCCTVKNGRPSRQGRKFSAAILMSY